MVAPVTVHPDYSGNLRNDISQWCGAEHAIHIAMYKVDKLGAGLHLTNAISLLSQAKQAIARHLADEIETG